MFGIIVFNTLLFYNACVFLLFFNLIKDSIEKCGEDTDCARDYILSLKSYQTSRGVFGFDESGELINVAHEVIKVK